MKHLPNYVRGYSFGRITYPNGGRFGPIMRPYISLLAVEDGTCTMRTEAGELRVAAGQTGVAIGRKTFEFLYQKGRSTTANWCEGFLPHLQGSDVDSVRDSYGPITTSLRLEQLVRIGTDMGLASNPELNALRDAVGNAVYRAFLLDIRNADENQTIPKAILFAQRYIRENLGDDRLDVATVSRHAGITEHHLIRTFKKHTGTTPSRYLWRVRAATARHYLIHSGLSQSEIAFKCGFKSIPHFSRTIRKMFGMTPSELRIDMGFTQPSDTENSVVDIVF